MVIYTTDTDVFILLGTIVCLLVADSVIGFVIIVTIIIMSSFPFCSWLFLLYVFVHFVRSSSRGFGFVSFNCFEASDASIEAMNGQFLCNRPISVSYAFKKDSQGERHGSVAERLLAAKNPILKCVFMVLGPYGCL